MSKPSRSAQLVRFVGPLAILVGVGGIVLAMFLTNTGGTESVVITNNPAIEALIPAPDSEVLRQSQVGVDLAAGYQAELQINGIDIPPDQVNVLRSTEDPDVSSDIPGSFDTALSRFLYQPLEGRAVPELKGDENCVVVRYWPLSDPTNIDTAEWCFTVA